MLFSVGAVVKKKPVARDAVVHLHRPRGGARGDVRGRRARGIEIDIYHVPLPAQVNRAVADGEDGGFVRVHVRKGGDEILGATIVASHAGEFLSEITLAMVAKLGLGKILEVIHPVPDPGRGDQTRGRPLHTHARHAGGEEVALALDGTAAVGSRSASRESDRA
jgi:hypothetical protein